MTDPRTYIKVHDHMPDHPKVLALSARAFRLLIESWCWCSRHLTDGFIPDAAWRKRSTPRARAELLAAGLAEAVEGGVMMHDYLTFQRSAAEVEQIRRSQGQGGSYGNHVRWHVRQRVTRPGCPHCYPSNRRSSHTAHNPGTKTNPVSTPPTARTVDYPGDEPVDNAVNSNNAPESRTEPIGPPIGSGSVPDRRDNYRGKYMGPSVPIGGPVDRHRADRYAGARAREEPHPFGAAVAAGLRDLTGRTVSDEHASAVARLILRGRQVSDPRAYLAAALRADPAAFLPTEGDPSRRPLSEAVADALALQPCPHGATGPERCPMCRRARSAPPSGPSATSISDEASSNPSTSDQRDGPLDGQAPKPPNLTDASAEPGPAFQGEQPS